MKKTAFHLLSLAAITTLTVSAHAQYQINNGTAADANTRAGSYGSNGFSQEGNINSATVNGNQIVTGNVAGGRSLRTNAGYFAPGQLETTTGDEQFQNFVRDSAGVPSSYQQNQPSYVGSRAFYGASTTAAPPSGFVRDSTTGSYVAAPAQLSQMGYDTRINIPPVGGFSAADAGLASGASVIPQTSAVSGAPLYGPRVSSEDLQQATSPFGNGYKQWSPQDQLALNQQSLDQMRAELNQPQGTQQNNGPGDNTNSLNTPPGVTPGAITGQMVNPGPLNTSITPPAPATNGQTQSRQSSPAAMTPAQQSSQYAQMQQRFQQLANGSPGALPGNDSSKQNNSTATPAPAPGVIETPAEAQKRHQAELYPPSVAVSPLMIHSLAVGIRARGLRSLMADAEEHMRQGKYAEALIRYAGAYQVAPNNPLISLGRSFAELGAGYYARADRDLRGAVQTDPVLLMGRYDLRNFLGSDRLEYVVRDLKQIAATDKQNASAPFLLAYIAYNTGSSSAAGDYLDLAEQRSGGHQPLIESMRQYWGLSSAVKK